MFFETLKANLLIIIFFGIVIGLGYWGVVSLQVDPSEFDGVTSDIRPIIENEPTGYSNEKPTSDSPVATPSAPAPQTPSTPAPSSGENSSLITALQKLADDNVLMKKGSRGTRVGTVQEFLNIYNGTDSKIDNDFGATTENQIKAFQKSEGLTADGQAGPGTYKKMIEWLKKQ